LNLNGVWGILSFTFKESIRTKWLMIFTAVFFFLAINLPNVFLSAARVLPPEYLASNLSTLLSVAFPLIPLLALPTGATSIVEDREAGTLQFLLSNPITKSEFFLGRGMGLLAATTVVIIIGFGAAAMVAYRFNVGEYYSVITTMLFAGMLNATMLALALIISSLSKRKATAMGIGIFAWFLFTVVSDLGDLSIAINLKVGSTASLLLILLNPVETTRILTVIANKLPFQQLGSPGLIASFLLGNSLFFVLLSSVMFWIWGLFLIGFAIFRRQDAV
jgi:ABC-type transport system involved in multi-copper enzyme maturation permease subunit